LLPYRGNERSCGQEEIWLITAIRQPETKLARAWRINGIPKRNETGTADVPSHEKKGGEDHGSKPHHQQAKADVCDSSVIPLVRI